MWARKGIYLVLHVYFIVSLEGNEAALLCINKHFVLYFFRRYTPGQAAPRSRRWVLVTGGLASYWYHNDNTRNLYQHHLNPEFAWSLIGEDVCWPRFCLATMPTHQTNCPKLFDLPFAAADTPSNIPSIHIIRLLSMAVPTPIRDPLLQHMFAYLNPRRDELPSHIVETIAGE